MWVVKGWGCRFRRAPPRPPGSRARFILETLNLISNYFNINLKVKAKTVVRVRLTLGLLEACF